MINLRFKIILLENYKYTRYFVITKPNQPCYFAVYIESEGQIAEIELIVKGSLIMALTINNKKWIVSQA
jgi:hypothetical protein